MYLFSTEFIQWQFVYIMFRFVLGCVWRREAKNEASQSFPWPSIDQFKYFENQVNGIKEIIAEEIGTCQHSQHSWASLPLLFCWRLFCRAPIHYEEIPAGEPKTSFLEVHPFYELGHNSGVPSWTPNPWSSFIWPQKTFAGHWLHDFPCFR